MSSKGIQPQVIWQDSLLSRSERWAKLGAKGATVWLTGFSGSGKSSIASELERLWINIKKPAYILDGDNVRHGLNADLGFSSTDRDENVRRVSEVARLLADAGCLAIVPLISPYLQARERARQIHKDAELVFLEVFVDTPIEICEQRDPKGLYKKARAGELSGFTGIDDPYEAPQNPELRLTPQDGNPEEQAKKIADLLEVGF